MYDLAIIGGGPAGVAAGVYASRKRLKTVFITKDFGGQSSVSEEIQNWIGTPKISGSELAAGLKKHLETYAADIVDIKEGELCEKIEKKGTAFVLRTSAAEYSARAILITAGSHRRKLDVSGAAEYENKGITYCASCDGPLFAGQDVAIIGGGNAAFDSAAQLLAYCKSVTIVNRSDEFRADPATVKKVLSNPKMHALTNAALVKIDGGKFVKSLTYKNQDGEEKELAVTGIFVEIGSVPSTDFLAGLVALNQYGMIVTDPKTQKTSQEGIWAAGDVTDGLYHQNNIAAGDAVKALEDIYLHLHTK
jgi:alkyl hydroperoxide reductase subunit F